MLFVELVIARNNPTEAPKQYTRFSTWHAKGENCGVVEPVKGRNNHRSTEAKLRSAAQTLKRKVSCKHQTSETHNPRNINLFAWILKVELGLDFF